MADITLKLVWYKLGETASNMVERYERFLEWYAAFSWRRVDILDMLFLGWLLAAFVVVGCINIYLKFFKGQKNQIGASAFGGTGESCHWINSAISWMFLHYNQTPAFIDCWVRALNEHVVKHNSDIQVRFERIQAGSLPPRFTHVTTQQQQHTTLNTQQHKETLTLCVGVECTDLGLQVCTSPQAMGAGGVGGGVGPQGGRMGAPQGPGGGGGAMTTMGGSAMGPRATATTMAAGAGGVGMTMGGVAKSANCDVIIQRLYGQIQVISQHGVDSISMQASFQTPPEIKLQVRQRSFDSTIDPRRLEAAVREAISGAVTIINLSPQLHINHSSYTTTADGAPLTLANNALTSMSLKNRRLLVKVIKATSIGEKEASTADAYCVVQMDEPLQKHTTSVVKGTNNPFWDEHFLFDLEERSQRIRFEVFDREKPPGNDFIGHATLMMAELRRTPSSRQILPLSSQRTSSTKASLTVEFLFMDPADTHQLAAGGGGALGLQTGGAGDMSTSPRRRIDTNRTVTPGGTTITTTTTTTERRKNAQGLDQPYIATDMPHRVEKTDTSFQSSDYSPYNKAPNSGGGGTANAHAAALQHGTLSRQGNKPMARKVTAADRATTMPISTTDSSAIDDKEQYSPSMMSTDSYEQRRDMKKSKSFASAIKRRFQRGPKKARSHSADRASSLRGDPQHLLKPPPQTDGNKTTDDLDQAEIPDSSMRKSRSHSFSSSMKRLFGKKKKGQASRESSVSRMSTHRYGDTSRDISTAQASPDIAYRDTPGMPLSHPSGASGGDYGTRQGDYGTRQGDYGIRQGDYGARQGDYGARESRDYPYSTSVPPSQSPLYDH